VTHLIDYEAFCGVGAPPVANGEISAADAAAAAGHDPSTVLVDVREPFEWDIVHVDGARHVPLRDLPARLRELDGHADVLVYCHHGTRSRQAVELLRAAGFSKVRSVRGGIDAWAAEVDRRLTRY
jgi:adenylyltransferase/sulfurtransferase